MQEVCQKTQQDKKGKKQAETKDKAWKHVTKCEETMVTISLGKRKGNCTLLNVVEVMNQETTVPLRRLQLGVHRDEIELPSWVLLSPEGCPAVSELPV